MLITAERVVPDHLADATWRLYNDAFDELRAAAVQRHVMHRGEFDDVLADHRVIKYLGLDPDRPDMVLALATFTNDLEAMPLISPDYFARRWPVLYAEQRIWYIGSFAIDPEYRGHGMFEGVIAEMWQRVMASRGIAALDICRRNNDVGLPKAIHLTLDNLTAGVRTSQLDEQVYWLFEPPVSA
jgi:ribosomal protein S18 acetylase RimI-like enzyme